MSDLVIGIDLGTTYSCVGVIRNNAVEIIANDQGNRTMPSCVAFTESGERIIGEAAKNQAAMNPARTIFDSKRMIGRTYNDPALRDDLKTWPFSVVEDAKHKPCIRITDAKGTTTLITPEEVGAMILGKLKADAETYLGEPVKRAVITVPAYFNDSQRQATKDAATIAGLHVVRILNEPTAAALGFGYGLKEKAERVIFVFDLGGGTFDVSLLTTDTEVYEVKATSGNTHLGGEDIDQVMMEYCMAEFKSKHKKDLSTNKTSLRRLRTACERAKRTLSSQLSATIEIDSLLDGVDFTTVITRARFEHLCRGIFDKCVGPMDRVFQDAKVSKQSVTEILMVGGTTRIPKIREMVATYFQCPLSSLRTDINPDEAVAYGAAVSAGLLSNNKRQVDNKDILLVDVIPLSIGIQVGADQMHVMVARNRSIPCEVTQAFAPTMNNQPAVAIRIFQGERMFVRDNHALGEFTLELPPNTPQQSKINVTYNIDANGTLNVSASLESKGECKKSIKIKDSSSRLTAEEIKSLVDAAANFKQDDEKRVHLAQLREELAKAIEMCNSAEDKKTFMSWMDEHAATASAEELQAKLDTIRSASTQQPATAPTQTQAPSGQAPATQAVKVEELD